MYFKMIFLCNQSRTLLFNTCFVLENKVDKEFIGMRVSTCYVRTIMMIVCVFFHHHSMDCFYKKNLENRDFLFFFFNIQSITDDIIIIADRHYSFLFFVEVTKRRYCRSFKIKKNDKS
jgi:hypothetical protein